MNHDETREAMHRYRDLAIRITQGVTMIKVTEIANVHLMDDGAFVEAQLWIPKSELERMKK